MRSRTAGFTVQLLLYVDVIAALADPFDFKRGCSSIRIFDRPLVGGQALEPSSKPHMKNATASSGVCARAGGSVVDSPTQDSSCGRERAEQGAACGCQAPCADHLGSPTMSAMGARAGYWDALHVGLPLAPSARGKNSLRIETTPFESLRMGRQRRRFRLAAPVPCPKTTRVLTGFLPKPGATVTREAKGNAERTPKF